MALTVFEEGRVSLDPQKALYIPVGAASPLWLLFAGAASAGVAYWWMTRWTDRANLEALLAKPAADVVPAVVDAAPEAPVEIAEAAAQATTATVEAAAETAETVVETVIEPEPEAAPKTRTKVRPATEAPTGE